MTRIFKAIFLTLNVLVLILLLASTLAGVVPPSKFICFSLLSYGYLYFLVINVVFILIWLLLSSKWFLLSLVGILLRMSFIPLYFQVGGNDKIAVDDDSGAQYLKVMTFNAHGFRGVELSNGINDSNVLAFIKIVEEERPDVLLMQEYFSSGKKVRLADSLSKMGYIHQTSGFENGTITINAIFSKLPVVMAERIEGHSYFYADLLWGDDTLRLYNLHLNSYQLDETDQKQIHDISHGNLDKSTGRTTLRKFRETILAHEMEWHTLSNYFEGRDNMTIVAGDFNDTPASFFYQCCRKSLVDSYCEAGQGFSTTYHGVFTRRASFPAFRIDMMLHTDDMEAVAYRRIKSDISDHYPIVVTLKK